MPKHKKHRRTHQFQGKRFDVEFDRKSDADDWKQMMVRNSQRAKAGLPVALDGILVQEYCAEWILLRQKKTPEWKIEEARLRKHILPRIGTKRLRFITTHEIESAMHDIREEQKYTFTTFNRFRALLHKIFNDAKKAGHRDDNPVTPIQLYAEDTYEPVEAEDAHLERYLIAAKAYPGFFQFVVSGMNTGSRPGEIITWKWKDLRPEQGLVLINRRFVRSTGEVKPGTKGKHKRYVPLNGTLLTCLEQWRAQAKFKGPEDFIFHREDGSIASINTYNDIHKRVREAAGIPVAIRLYDLTRHAYASRLAEKGNMRLVQLILGHKDVKTTERYAHKNPNFVQRGVDLEIGMEHVKIQ